MFVICWSSMVVDIYYNSRSHPSGYTDDLGIMSDQYNDVMMLMNSLQGMGIDYPEFAAIRKSIAVELNKKKEA